MPSFDTRTDDSGIPVLCRRSGARSERSYGRAPAAIMTAAGVDRVRERPDSAALGRDQGLDAEEEIDHSDAGNLGVLEQELTGD